MIASDRKLGRLYYSNGYACSPQLKVYASRIFAIKKQKRECSLANEKGKMRLQDLGKQLIDAYKDLRLAQIKADDTRKEHINLIAEKRSKQWNTLRCKQQP